MGDALGGGGDLVGALGEQQVLALRQGPREPAQCRKPALMAEAVYVTNILFMSVLFCLCYYVGIRVSL